MERALWEVAKAAGWLVLSGIVWVLVCRGPSIRIATPHRGGYRGHRPREYGPTGGTGGYGTRRYEHHR